MVSKLKNVQYLPTAFTIFGITGDLSRRKLLPALYDLFMHDLLPEDSQVIGVARDSLNDDSFSTLVRESIKTYTEGARDFSKIDDFLRRFVYVSGDVTSPALYTRLRDLLENPERVCRQPHQSIFYFAVAPQLFIPIVDQLSQAKLSGPCAQFGVKAKLVIEKPFGHTLQSAQELNDALLQYVEEGQIYRMDHYLGKENVQNILLFRFTNPLINDSWDPASIERIDIANAEDVGVEQRAAYYDHAGALRDMVQSHCLALLTLATMDEPMSLTSADIHHSKEQILNTFSVDQHSTGELTTLRAQHTGYHNIPHVQQGSTTETYAALQLHSSHPRWKSVPFYIHTGKRLHERSTTIRIAFSPCKSNICKTQGIKTEPNILTIRLRPDEGITLRLYAKKPGFTVSTETVDMGFSYTNSFSGIQPSAYERLLHDIIIGDQSLFPNTAEVIQQWKIIQPVLDAWSNNSTPLYSYEPGSTGPTEAAAFLGQS